MKYPNIYALFRERVAEYAGRDVFYVREGGGWRGISWARFGEDAHAVASALLASGLGRGAAACVLMGNVPEWPVCDLGVIAAGGVSCGLYPTGSADQCRYIIEHSDAEFVFVDTAAQLEKVLSVREGLTKVKQFVVLDAGAARGRGGVVSFAEFLRTGRERRAETAAGLRERRGRGPTTRPSWSTRRGRRGRRRARA
jgi:long-chain acyl-CoA synthetase